MHADSAATLLASVRRVLHGSYAVMLLCYAIDLPPSRTAFSAPSQSLRQMTRPHAANPSHGKTCTLMFCCQTEVGLPGTAMGAVKRLYLLKDQGFLWLEASHCTASEHLVHETKS